MTSSAAVSSVFDINSLAALKGSVKRDDPKALKAAAQQFEALFMQMMLKSMRDATPREGLFDSEQSRMYESLLDQQLAQVMSTKGSLGLAAMIEKQLSRAAADPVPYEDGLPLAPPAPALPLERDGRLSPLAPQGDSPRALPLDRVPASPVGVASPLSGGAPAMDALPPAARDFVASVWPHAVEASRATGIPAQFLVAQAALETGWGRAEPRHSDGSPSHNLFGIKSGRAWKGASVEAATAEYEDDGSLRRQVARFRAYDSYADSFRDYANLLLSNPRYADVIGARDPASFARGLQKAGYATDPAYSAKLERIIGGQTLRAALSA